MDHDSLEDAILRLDAAVTRAETALAARPAAPAPALPDDSGPAGDSGLAERHAALRASTADALARLDRLIESDLG